MLVKYKFHISIDTYNGVDVDNLMDSLRQHLINNHFECVISPITNVILCFKYIEDYENHLEHLHGFLNILNRQFDYVSTIVPSPVGHGNDYYTKIVVD